MTENNLLAILGPTNTGKTFLAFERLISYKSGIFGFPLRLLARENYDKAIAKLGIHQVALITGEEKIIPKDAKYYFCTVESMPLKIEVECIAIDEIQLCAEYERGHIFTDRVLNLRGLYETIFLGSTTIEKILIKLFPKITINKRDRFSKLSFLPKQNLSKLIPRSAIIAFNINSVYELAESLRMYKGGAAVVLGSLSPRTRNAQVEIYEEKKVDYLVATDAIGMGLNLNINHVSFSSFQKYDGRRTRKLQASEIGQIAGRAGRYLNDGTFGYLNGADQLDPFLIKSIEDHEFDDINKIYWRNSDIDFNTIESVINSFKKFPLKSFFIHKKNAEDEINFRALSNDITITPHLKNSTNISLLWDVCHIPDFQKIFNDSYLALLKEIFLSLINNNGLLDDKWLQNKILRLENYTGGIQELSIKIENIRTWTYITNQSQWIYDCNFWQEKTREIENNLSDHLHESLTNRFVDVSASYFINTQNRGEEIAIEIGEDKSIKLNGQKYGYINGFDLELEISKSESLFSQNYVKKSIRSMIEDKINNFLNAPFDSINLGDISKLNTNEDIKIYWGDEPIGRLIAGLNLLSPKVDTLNSEFLESDKKILVNQKLQKWLDDLLFTNLKAIKEPIDETVSPEVRAIIFNVFSRLGTMETTNYQTTIKNLNEHDKAVISRSGIRIGAKFFFMPNLLKKFPIELCAVLWKVFNNPIEKNLIPLPTDGRVSFVSEIEMLKTYWESIGYICLNKFAIRIDVLERVFFIARQKYKYGPFIESADMMNPLGCNSQQLKNILFFCGFSNLNLGNDKYLYFNKLKKKENIKNIFIKKNKVFKVKNTKKVLIKPIKNNSKLAKTEKKNDPNSPFAVLQKLL